MEGSHWKEYSGRQKVRCPTCDHALCEVAPGTRLEAREKPIARIVGERQLTIRCEQCKTEVDVRLL